MHIGHEHNFNKASPEVTHAFGVGYDYSSVMHYSSTAFSKNYQLKTIMPKVSEHPCVHFHICSPYQIIINCVISVECIGLYRVRQLDIVYFANCEIALYIIYMSMYLYVETTEWWNFGSHWRSLSG